MGMSHGNKLIQFVMTQKIEQHVQVEVKFNFNKKLAVCVAKIKKISKRRKSTN